MDLGMVNLTKKQKNKKKFKTNKKDLWVTPERNASLLFAFSIVRKETKIYKKK